MSQFGSNLDYTYKWTDTLENQIRQDQNARANKESTDYDLEE